MTHTHHPASPVAITAANPVAPASARSPSHTLTSNASFSTALRALEASQNSFESDLWSARSNASISSYDSGTREMHRHTIASTFFGPISNATAEIMEEQEHVSMRSVSNRKQSFQEDSEKKQSIREFRPRRASESALIKETTVRHTREQRRSLRQQLALPLDSPSRENETPEERSRRRENRLRFEHLVHLANTYQPVQFDTFKKRQKKRKRDSNKSLTAQLRRSGSMKAHNVSEIDSADENSDAGDEEDETINTELLEAYIAYSKSIGHEPKIELNPMNDPCHDYEGNKNDGESRYARASYIHERPVLEVQDHCWTNILGTRFSKRRGCMQFWTWLMIGVGVLLWLGMSLSSLQLNEVLHLDAFTAENVQIFDDYTFLHLLEEVDFHLTYTIDSSSPNANATFNASYFNVLLLNEDEYEHYIDGESYEYIEQGSILRTTYAYLPNTYIDNVIQETMFFVIQPCYLKRNPGADYCQLGQLPTSVTSREKVYDLGRPKNTDPNESINNFTATFISVNPMPLACSSSGWVGGSYLLLFLPYVIITCFGLRVFQIMLHCENWQTNLERIYSRELRIPENEVDYWQPMPWDRKVPKTRLCGPWCWTKFRRPFEPFYTWWRHENYFTWIFYPYRNERLSRGERALIVVCSLYITFYVLFIIVMLRDSYGENMTIFTSVVLYAILIAILPSAGKAIFKELFKLIFRQRRKYFRAKATGGNLGSFSFRFAFLLQLLVVLLLTMAQIPMFYIWAYRSCLFLKKFMWCGVLAAIMRMSLFGLLLDFGWYLIIKTWGWKDLCPYCTERMKHCDCFNDELLILAVERVGPKWQLIQVLDTLLAKQHDYSPQFELYTSAQLRERWAVLVERAEKHMEKIDKLCAYHEKKRLEALRYDRVRRSLTSFVSFRGIAHFGNTFNDNVEDLAPQKSLEFSNISNSTEETRKSELGVEFRVCSLREQKILGLNNKIKLDSFEKHYDSTISEVFHALTRSVQRFRHHAKGEIEATSLNLAQIPEDPPALTLQTQQFNSASSNHGETMWVLDTPAQRLERREKENLQRKQAFRVLNDYKIESVDSNFEANVISSSMLSPIRSRQGSRSALRKNWNGLHDSKKDPLLNRSMTEELVIFKPVELDSGKSKDKVNLDEVASVCVEDYSEDEQVDDEYSIDLERGTCLPQTVRSLTRIYSVTERPNTLLRRVSSSASTFAAWALKYDPNV